MIATKTSSVKDKLQRLLHALYEANYDYSVEFITVDDSEYMYLYSEDKLVFIVKVIIEDRLLKKKEVVNELNQFRRIGKEERCFNFRIVAPGGFSKSALELEQFNMIMSDNDYLSELRKDIIPFELYPHNYITYKKILSMFKESNRVGIVQTTGTGKSVLIAQYAFDNPDKNVLILSPNKFVFGQLKKFIKHRETISYITYAKSRLLSKKELKALKADIIILDEYHRAGAEEWSNGVDALLEAYPNANVLGTTATPERSDERNMADELFDGNLAVNITLNRAIQEYIVPAPYYVSALYTLDEEAERLKSRILNSNSEQKEHLVEKLLIARNNWEKSKGVPTILQKHVPSDARKLIVFCKDIEHLQEMEPVVCDWFRKAGFGDVKTFVVHSQVTNTQDVFNAFENDDSDRLNLLFSVNMLNEGVHIHGIDGEIFLRKTDSNIIYFQQLGRGITVDFAKQPLVIDLVNNFRNVRWSYSGDKQIELNRSFDEIDDIEVGLQVFDEIREINELFDSFSNEIESWVVFVNKLTDFYKKYGHTDVTNSFKDKHLYNRVIRTRHGKDHLSAAQIDDLNKLDFIWNKQNIPWLRFLNNIKKFKLENGHCLVPATFPNNQTFGNKVGYYRSNKNVLTQEQIIELDNLGFIWNIIDKKWNDIIDQLIDYKNQHGDLLIEAKRPFMKLYNKAHTIRRNKNSLSKRRISQLNDLGFIWSSLTDQKFESFYTKLSRYFEQFGTTHVPANYHDKRLYSGVRYYKERARQNKLSSSQLMSLKKLSFLDSYNMSDEIFLTEITKFKNKYGHCDVPINFANQKLANKTRTIRSQKGEGKLSIEIINYLDKIEFAWSIHDKKWESFINALLAHKAKFGHCNPTHSENQVLGSKCSSIRSKKDTLSADKIEQLDSLGFKWVVLVDKWPLFISELESFFISHGHTMVPRDKVKNSLFRQSVYYSDRANQNKLTISQINQLENLNFPFHRQPYSWDSFKKELSKFYSKNKHTNIPSNHSDIKLFSTKIHYQLLYANNKITNDKIKQLNKLKFNWNF